MDRLRTRKWLIGLALVTIVGILWAGWSRRSPPTDVTLAKPSDTVGAAAATPPVSGNSLAQPGSAPASDAVPEEFQRPRSLRITGWVFDPDDKPAVAQLVAFGEAPWLHLRSSTESSAAGDFSVRLEVPRSCKSVWLEGQGMLDGEIGRVIPVNVPLSTRDEYSVYLVVRPGAVITGKVVSATPGSDSSPQRVLLSQLPNTGDMSAARWNESDYSMVDTILPTESDGKFRAVVRAGRFRIRAMSATGALGRPMSGEVAAGAVYNIGSMEAAGGSRDATIVVCDPTGHPVEGAAVQLSDRDYHLVSERGGTEARQFQTDSQGRVVLHGVQPNCLPILVAATARGYSVGEADLASLSSDCNVTLTPRPPIRIRLVGPGAAALTAADLAEFHATWLTPDPFRESSERGPAPAEVLAFTKGQPVCVVEDNAAKVLRIDRTAHDGKFNLSLRLGTTSVRTSEIRILEGSNNPIDVPLVHVFSVAVRLQLPARVNLAVARQFLRGWVKGSSATDKGTIQFDIRGALDAAGRTIRVWVPEEAVALGVTSECVALLPLSESEARITTGSPVVLSPQLFPTAVDLRIEVRGAANELVGSKWPLMILAREVDAGCRMLGGAFETDDRGVVKFPVLPGPFEVRSERSFAHPFAVTRAVAGSTGETIAVLNIMGRTPR